MVIHWDVVFSRSTASSCPAHNFIYVSIYNNLRSAHCQTALAIRTCGRRRHRSVHVLYICTTCVNRYVSTIVCVFVSVPNTCVRVGVRCTQLCIVLIRRVRRTRVACVYTYMFVYVCDSAGFVLTLSVSGMMAHKYEVYIYHTIQALHL